VIFGLGCAGFDETGDRTFGLGWVVFQVIGQLLITLQIVRIDLDDAEQDLDRVLVVAVLEKIAGPANIQNDGFAAARASRIWTPSRRSDVQT